MNGTVDTALDFQYKYDSTGGGGVHVYIIGAPTAPVIQHAFVHSYSPDTGIFTNHPAFEGRASWGKTFGGYPDHDGYGHGTHCAGIAVSAPYGVAKSANVVAVKVLNDNGVGQASDV